MHVNLVKMYGEPKEDPPLLGLIVEFKERILKAAHRPEDADVLLSTVCQAKGLEWPRVEVLDDCIHLDVIKRVKPGEGGGHAVLFAPDSNAGDPGCTARPDWKGDEVNSWFVAVTRAQKKLRLPQRWWELQDLAARRAPTTDAQDAWWQPLAAAGLDRAAANLLNGLRKTIGVQKEEEAEAEEATCDDEEDSDDDGNGDSDGDDDDGDDDADDDDDDGGVLSTGKRRRELPSRIADPQERKGRKLDFAKK